MGYPRDTDKRDAKIIAEAAYMPTAGLVRKYGLGERQVQIILRRAGVRAQRPSRRKTTLQKLEALEAEFGLGKHESSSGERGSGADHREVARQLDPTQVD